MQTLIGIILITMYLLSNIFILVTFNFYLCKFCCYLYLHSLQVINGTELALTFSDHLFWTFVYIEIFLYSFCFPFSLYLFYFICTLVSYTYTRHACRREWKLEEGIRFREAGAIGNCELTSRCWELNLSLPQHQVFINTQPSPQYLCLSSF